MVRIAFALLLLAATAANALDRVIVEFRSGAPVQVTVQQFRRDVASIDTRSGKTAVGAIRYEYRHAMSGAALELPADSVAKLKQLPYVKQVWRDMPMQAFAAAPSIVASDIVDAAARVNAKSLGTRGDGIRVGVIDTGIDYNHSAFGGGFGPGHKVAGGWNFAYHNGDPMDDHGHGTHVAGIIAADSPELAGVAPGATLYAYKVLNNLGQGDSSDVIAAIERSIDPNQDGDTSDHLDVINLSLGGLGTADDPVSLAADRATAAGIVVVIAAGNEGAGSTVRSPGTSRTAITVGAIDDAGKVTSYSSKGPGPEHLTFKPDVVAPGDRIVSAKAGGGLVAFSGTSMASPHVAGVAALLRRLHPEWKPSDVRSAIVTTAQASSESVAFRGAGRVDAANANASTNLLDSSGISFGLAPGTAGTSQVVRTVNVTNRSSAAHSLAVVAAGLPPGATLSANPATLQLDPGATKPVELTLSVDNVNLPFPDDYAIGGAIRFDGDGAFTLPWLVMRAARMNVRFDLFSSYVTAVSPGGTKQLESYDFGKAEIFGRPGTVLQLMMPGVEQGDDFGHNIRLITAQDQVLNGDAVVNLRGSDASVELILGSRDSHGVLLSDFSRAHGGVGRLLTFIFESDKTPGQPIEYVAGSWYRIFISPMTQDGVLHLFEAIIDPYLRSLYNVQYPELHGLTQSVTLNVDPSSYLHTAVHFDPQVGDPILLSACGTNGLQHGAAPELHSLVCGTDVLHGPATIDYYTTRESGTGVSGIMFRLIGGTWMQALRGIGDSIISTDFTPSDADYRIENDETITVGARPLFPRSFPGTTNGVAYNALVTKPGFHGPYNELDEAWTYNTPWTAFNASNNPFAAGTVGNLLNPGPYPQAGGRYVAGRNDLHVGTLASRGLVEVQFSSDTGDLGAPTLTTMRVVDGQGRVADQFDAHETATLLFSAGDYDYTNDIRTRPLKSEATRVSYRHIGTESWQPLSVVLSGSDNGVYSALGHPPAGDLYRIDLGPAMSGGPVDLRIEIEDVHGNRSTWTQTPAFSVVQPPRRRAAR